MQYTRREKVATLPKGIALDVSKKFPLDAWSSVPQTMHYYVCFIGHFEFYVDILPIQGFCGQLGAVA